MFMEDINKLNTFWLENPETDIKMTFKFAEQNCFLSNPLNQNDIDRILKEYEIFHNRRVRKMEEPSHWSKPYESPLGSNPFMDLENNNESTYRN
jgi:hypothetical protein